MEFPEYYTDPIYLNDVTPGMLNTIRHNWMLPCSICGCEGSIHNRVSLRGERYWVACVNQAPMSKCSFQITDWHYRLFIKTAEQAINYWNFLQWCNKTKPFDKNVIRKHLAPSFFDDVVFT